MSHNGKSGVRHAADMVTPYATSAKDNAVQYAHQAGAYLGPRARRAATKAKLGYDTQLVPRMERAVAAAGPARNQAAARSQAAMAALRGDISAGEIRGAMQRKARRQRAGRMVRRLGMLGLAAGGAYAAWRWWSGQGDPDWTMEPSPATEVNPEAGEGSNG
ncbi:DUF5324 family protein [Streptomyces sp. SBT349]|uniref:DUF5324 family protein n=1 Tax=Streptomyces sp. SBT349 TaxID=1580539 RepID=UPI00066DAC55|nr:DUF5324 family protein [Streptomyces sp. SBT349]